MNSIWALSALLAIAPAQTPATSAPNISNVRHTLGELGPTRADNRYLPYDMVRISFDIEGLKASPEGKVSFSMAFETLDKAGKAVDSYPLTKDEKLLPLGGGKLPAYVFLPMRPELQPGTFTCKITIQDDTTKASKSVEQKFELLPPSFGIVKLFVSKDDRQLFGLGPVGIVGQTVFINFSVVGVGRNAQQKTDAEVAFRVLDSNNQPTTAQPIVMPVPPTFPSGEPFVPFQVMLPMNREGSFTVEIKAADKVTNKSSTLTFPLRVHPAAK